MSKRIALASPDPYSIKVYFMHTVICIPTQSMGTKEKALAISSVLDLDVLLLRIHFSSKALLSGMLFL